MSNAAIFFDDWENKPLVIPVSNCAVMRLSISTRNYNAIVIWGDDTENNYVASKNIDATINPINALTKTYTPNFTGDIKVYLKGGLNDVYSYRFQNGYISSGIQYNIQDLGLFFAQMPNLYSYNFDIHVYGDVSKQSTIIGDFAQNPDSVERILISAVDVKNKATALVLNFNNFKNTSKLKWFRKETGSGGTQIDALRFIGDIAKIPPLCTYFYISKVKNYSIYTNSAITYTSGKVWASSFDTLQMPLPLTTPELDNLLIDMDNSITTKIGDGVIALGGSRSSVSDSAVASLQAKGFTVDVLKQLGLSFLDSSVIFRADFQNNFDVYSNSYIGVIAGDISNQPTFALSGRKSGEYCAVFNGSQSIKTAINLPINSDKVTIAFWMKTTQNESTIITELSDNVGSNNDFYATHYEGGSGGVVVRDRSSAANIKKASFSSNDGSWRHIVIVIDRNLDANNSTSIYVNSVKLSLSTMYSSNAETTGNFVNNILFIGQRGGNTLGFRGSLTRLKIYNYPFTPTEVTNLYNSEL